MTELFNFYQNYLIQVELSVSGLLNIHTEHTYMRKIGDRKLANDVNLRRKIVRKIESKFGN